MEQKWYILGSLLLWNTNTQCWKSNPPISMSLPQPEVVEMALTLKNIYLINISENEDRLPL